ncbi:MAG TPA: imidazole glycerol phosphate synthase subunit HisF [Pyrinomonadaceae bacterium]|nr:imidazole glycerol phosphate synthase subunit HisF [Pyrinomonadaceae bacterium]
MLAKRIIPCLDVKDGRVVKGVHFQNLSDAGDPVELARRYCEEGADELTLLDISATDERRKTLAKCVREVAAAINIPLTIGGGIGSVEDVNLLLEAGADKVSINTAAVRSPALISQAARSFGSQCVVVSIDAKPDCAKWNVYLNGGRERTDLDAIEWSRRCAELGAGEILLTSIGTDGTRSGFDLELTRRVSRNVSVPVIASGGAGRAEDFLAVFSDADADAALAASVFHYGKFSIGELKSYLQTNNIPVRL